MKNARMLTIFVVVLGMMVSLVQVSKAEPMGTAWTYQGRLIDANDAADGEYDFAFRLFDDANVVDGNQVGNDVNVPDVDVTDGYFTVELDFGSVFTGDARWLETAVRPGDSVDGNDFVTLIPRQNIGPTPYALYALSGGDITAVNAGTGLNGGGTSGDVTMNVDVPLSLSGSTDYSEAVIKGINNLNGYGVIGSGGEGGVYGEGSLAGVYGEGSLTGVYGSGSESGVEGRDSDTGAYGRLGFAGYGVYGNGTTYAGYFEGDCYIKDGDITIPQMMSYPWPSGGYNVKSFEGTLFYETSSSRYKENIEPFGEEFSKILQVEPKSYTCKKTGRREIGFIAEEFDDLGLCELVIYDQEGRPDAIAYQLISLYLLEVLKDEVETAREQEEAINQLEEKNRSLEERVQAMERTIHQLAKVKELEL